MPLDDRIHELYSRLATANNPDELCNILGLLRAALHEKIEYLTESAADVIRNTSCRTSMSTLTNASLKSPQRKPSAA